MLGAGREVRVIQRSLYSFKVLTECPTIIVLLFQLYRSSSNESHVEPFVPLVFKVPRLQHAVLPPPAKRASGALTFEGPSLVLPRMTTTAQTLQLQPAAQEAARRNNPNFVGMSPAISDRAAYADFVAAQVKVRVVGIALCEKPWNLTAWVHGDCGRLIHCRIDALVPGLHHSDIPKRHPAPEAADSYVCPAAHAELQCRGVGDPQGLGRLAPSLPLARPPV